MVKLEEVMIAGNSILSGSNLIATTQMVQNDENQELLIPRELRTEKTEFFIRKVGEVYIAYPTDDGLTMAQQAIGIIRE